MTETKHDKFVRLRDKRIPAATQAFKVLRNLAAPGYECSAVEAEELVGLMQKEVDDLRSAFGLTKPVVSEPTPAPPPPKKEAAGPLTRDWVVWAYENLRRGNKSEAEGMLERALNGDKY